MNQFIQRARKASIHKISCGTQRVFEDIGDKNLSTVLVCGDDFQDNIDNGETDEGSLKDDKERQKCRILNFAYEVSMFTWLLLYLDLNIRYCCMVLNLCIFGQGCNDPIIALQDATFYNTNVIDGFYYVLESVIALDLSMLLLELLN